LVNENGIPIIGANIVVAGTTHGTVTDIDGNFTLEGVVAIMVGEVMTDNSTKVANTGSFFIIKLFC